MINIGDHSWITLDRPIYVNGKKVLKVYVNGALVYPDEILDIPEKIEIIVKPYKRYYNDGEEIDMTGAVIRAFKKDGSIWTSPDYPNGIIPLDEITLSPDAVDWNSGEFVVHTDDGDTITYIHPDGYFRATYTRWQRNEHSGQPYENTNERIFERMTFPNGETPAKQTILGRLTVQKLYYNGNVTEQYKSRSVMLAFSDELVVSAYLFVNSWTYQGKTVAYLSGYDGGSEDLEIYDHEHNIYESISLDTNIPVSMTDGNLTARAAWYSVYGDAAKEITVSWPRPSDGKVLEATFEVLEY